MSGGSHPEGSKKYGVFSCMEVIKLSFSVIFNKEMHGRGTFPTSDMIYPGAAPALNLL